MPSPPRAPRRVSAGPRDRAAARARPGGRRRVRRGDEDPPRTRRGQKIGRTTSKRSGTRRTIRHGRTGEATAPAHEGRRVPGSHHSRADRKRGPSDRRRRKGPLSERWRNAPHRARCPQPLHSRPSRRSAADRPRPDSRCWGWPRYPRRLRLRGATPASRKPCRASEPVAGRLDPPGHRRGRGGDGDADAPAVPPAIAFAGPDGREPGWRTARGKTVLVNLWATWCVPCRQEMPALDRLQAELGGPDFEVVALNVDTRNADGRRPGCRRTAIVTWPITRIPAASCCRSCRNPAHVVGLPTTLLVDGSGCEMAMLKGPAEWASADAIKLMRAALGR